jgi:hypothetical protein
MSDSDPTGADTRASDEQSSKMGGGYLRFFAMIATAMVAMYGLTYVNTMELAHVRWNETRVYMTLVMGASMGLIMLGFMLGHYRSRKLNVAVVLISLFSGAMGLYLVRSQVTVQDRSFLKAMIPHHSIAILTSERSRSQDVRVCELQVAIIEAQRREIAEMTWLIDDIEQNGPAESVEAARARPVPDFEGTSSRVCPSD